MHDIWCWIRIKTHNLIVLYVLIVSGLRGSDEARKMKWGDMEIGLDEHGEFLAFTERQTKTRTGESGGTRKITPKAYENQEDRSRCPVTLFRKFSQHRPEKMLKDDAPFYLAVNYDSDGSDPRKWYKAAPLGKNTIGKFMKTMATAAKISGKKLNHSARKTSAERLLQANVPPTLIQNITGHKNVQSISNYAKASKNKTL